MKSNSIQKSQNSPPILSGGRKLTLYRLHNFCLNHFDTNPTPIPTVTVALTVTKNREKTNIRVVKGWGEPYDSEAIRTMDCVHYLRPAKADGKYIDSEDTFTIVFDSRLKLKRNCAE